MKSIYRNQWDLFKESYLKIFIWLFILFIASSFAVYAIMVKNPDLATTLMNQVSKMFEEKDLMGPDTTSFELALGLFKNNTLACITLLVTGFLPIFLPAIAILIMNGAIIGVMFAFMNLNGQAIMPMFFAGIVPHGIFEIPAIILSGALAFYVSLGVYRKINNGNYSFRACTVNVFKTFIFICIPLLVFAAIIEAFITPHILGSFI
ncbi:stage II sporulation protein M [Bacillus andreraoultii]|uniref:stage II sporulation protein M n=1 Tax=Bacillus andreraoultii TaxID=1499685 RepID=UPI00067F2ABD|nr:stage II sporulation protein M [Bacillus andreraoultii]